MIHLVKKQIQKLPYPLFLRFYYAWLIRNTLRAEYVRRKAGLPLLNFEALRKQKRRDILFILGCGPSINQISAERWKAISRHDTLGVNFWLYHPFVPTFYSAESISYDSRDTASRRLVEASNRRGLEYANTIKIISHLDEPGRQYIFDLSAGFRRNLYAVHILPVPARNEREFEYCVRYLIHKGAFDAGGGTRALVKHGQSLTLLLTLAIRLRYRKVVLCGIDMNSIDHFYDDPDLYPEAKWAKPASSTYGYDEKFLWCIRQSSSVYAMKRLLLDPAEIELYVENCTSALWPRIPEAPASLFAI